MKEKGTCPFCGGIIYDDDIAEERHKTGCGASLNEVIGGGE